MTMLSYFTVTGKIHEGSDTILYRGYRNADLAPVAVKVPKNEHPTSRELAKLRHEYSILCTLNVPGVVKAYSLEKQGHTLALVLEDLPGQPLDELIRGQKIELRIALQISIRLAEILDGIHRLNCIHKDIKPHNILISPNNKVHLIDFGIATQLSQETQRAMNPDSLEGSLAYMSPEQTGRMNRVTDYRTDFYSFGVTLYEMLTGELPFKSMDPMELLHGHIARRPAPPYSVDAGIPQAVSDIVMKLLSKTAEERYQSGRGLKADLEECLRQLENTGIIVEFPLGQRDHSYKLCLPQRLYGREAELNLLTASFARIGEGNAEVVLISGPAGIGKSALVNEISKSPAFQHGYFAEGKFEPIGSSVAPYRPIAQAFRGLLRQILSERAEALGRWQGKLQSTLESNAKLLCDLIPELELIIGPPPPVVPVGPTEAEKRFHLVFQDLCRVFCSAEHPLALFFDDLQFADPASLKLLQMLMTDPERHHFLIVGAYRDSEVAASHPLSLMLEELAKSSAVINRIALRPLEFDHVSALLTEALNGAPGIPALARLVLDKTHGNPFFVNQFLSQLHADGLLALDEHSDGWKWDVKRIHELTVTANVIPFMLEKVQRLQPSTQRVLEMASCIGYQFDLPTLSHLTDQTLEKTAIDLWEALRENLIVPVNADYRLVHGLDRIDSDAITDIKISYRFVHDRVREAAYSLLDDKQKRAAHLKVGRRFLIKYSERPQDDVLFDTVNHLNLGAELISNPQERAQLPSMNLAAGQKAKGASAYSAAVEYFSAGINSLSEDSWTSDYEVCFSLYLQRLECEYLSGHLEIAETLFSDVLAHARSDLDRAQAYNLRISLLSTLTRYADAVAAARTALALLGIRLPETEEETLAVYAQELAAIPEGLAGRKIAELYDAPLMQNPNTQMSMKLLMSCFPAALGSMPALTMVLAAKQVNLSLRYGNCDTSAFGYASYGMGLTVSVGHYREAFEWGSLALALNDKVGNVGLRCKLANLYGGFIHHFCKPLRAGLVHFEKGNQAGLECGDFLYLSFNCLQIILYQLGIGEELATVLQDVDRFLVLMDRTRETLAATMLTICKRLVVNLAGRTQGPLSLSDDSFDEELFVASMRAAKFFAGLYQYHQVQVQIRYLFGDYAGALNMAVEAEQWSPFVAGSYNWTEASFYICLIVAALLPTADEPTRATYTKLLETHLAKLAGWAETGAENFRHKHLLILAELARGEGKVLEAMALYDEAIEGARKNEFMNHEALANELAAKFYLQQGRRSIAMVYMGSAFYSYQRWGATAKTAQLVEKYATILPEEILSRQNGRGERGSITTTSTRIVQAGTMDVTTVLRAAQSIASEILLEKVLDQLMRCVLTNAGAQRGFLILKREERLFIEASMSLSPEEVQVGQHIPLASQLDLARSVVQYVMHTREPVVLGEAGHDKRFGNDPHIVARHPKSILCLALVHQGRLTGVVYLENNLANHAFTTDRVEMLQLLSSQAAIAVENAILYSHVQSVTDQLRRSNDELTGANERLQTVSMQLRQSNQELSKANEQLQVELQERARSEQQRTELQEQIIRVQSTRLAELSTPLIPITDRIMVMPLIGTMDSQRAQLVLETALQGAQNNRAQIVIIDITGMKHVDTSVAGTLISTAAALRLLGAQAVLTGIRAEIAQTLVSLGIDMGGVVTRSTLQSGIAYAVNRVGDSLARNK